MLAHAGAEAVRLVPFSSLLRLALFLFLLPNAAISMALAAVPGACGGLLGAHQCPGGGGAAAAGADSSARERAVRAGPLLLQNCRALQGDPIALHQLRAANGHCQVVSERRLVCAHRVADGVLSSALLQARPPHCRIAEQR